MMSFSYALPAQDLPFESALSIELPKTNTIVLKEASDICKDSFEKVEKVAYEEATAIILSGLHKFPANFSLQRNLATLLGDSVTVAPDALKERMLAKSKEIFQRLSAELEGQPKGTTYNFRNEYFYRFAMYREQYELGLARVADYWETDRWLSSGIWGYYSQGVGASNYAKKLIEEGNIPLAHEYAQKALVAWGQFFSYKNDYYNAYVHFATALGILGYTDDMMKALKKSASLIDRDLAYFEFKEVIDFVERYK